MQRLLRPNLLLVLIIFCAAPVLAQEAIPNWPAPPFWSPGQSDSGGSGMAAITSPLPFIGITPCRIADTRGLGWTGQAGPPSLNANVTRNFQITGTVTGVPAQCGIPAQAQAVSFNFAVTNITANGNLIAFPAGGTPPTVSSLNWQTGFAALSNAAVVPVSVAGGLGVQVNAAGGTTVDLIIDVNGYYAGAGSGADNTFLGRNAGNFTMTGNFNTGIGVNALESNTFGNSNTASGTDALFSNTTGNGNTASGNGALGRNTIGNANTASGFQALFNNTTGSLNTAVGRSALNSNTMGSNNTAIGFEALRSNTSGFFNTASGYQALSSNTTGDSNIAIGTFALIGNTEGGGNVAMGISALANNTTGGGNIGIGFDGGLNLTTGNNNICIGNPGVAADANTIRIGNAHTGTFIAGINGASVGMGSAVGVNASGQLGTNFTPSSRRVKQDIREIAEASDGLMKLRPVAFKYKPEIDPTGLVQYGLIAEEVAEVLPELVTYGRDGRVETVKYHVLPTLLLNEVQRQRRTIEEQNETIQKLSARLARVEAQLASPGER